MKSALRGLAAGMLAVLAGFCPRANGQAGIIKTVAGGGSQVIDGGQATSAYFNGLADISVDKYGNLYVADYGHFRVWKVSATGVITAVAGTGTQGFSGDGGPATSAKLGGPGAVTVDASGNILIADSGNYRIRKVSPAGIITTIAGNGTNAQTGDGGQATSASIGSPAGIAVDASGNLFAASSDRVRKVSANGTISTVAGGGSGGDGGLATSASLNGPSGVALDASGTLYIAESNTSRIRKVSVNGVITTVAGTGTAGFSGDGGPAISARLNSPWGVAADASGNLLIADTSNSRIRQVTPGGVITTIAGTGTAASSGDGGPATSAGLLIPTRVVVDPYGDFFITDSNGRVREVSGSTAPSISPKGIVPVYSSVGTIQPGEWVSIYGKNLAASTVSWNGNFPTSLGGTSVTINGKPAYLWYVSPTQINLQVPDDTTTGIVPVVVTTAGGTGNSSVILAPFAPSFLLLDGKHVTGIIPRSDGSGAFGGGSYDIIGPTGNSLGYPTVAAKPGDLVELFAVGLGPPTSAVPAGQVFSGAAPTANPVKVLINNNYVGVTPDFSGLSGSGLYQINITIPAGLGAGDYSLVAAVGGMQTPVALISLQNGASTVAGPCANIGGIWNVTESGSYTETIAATADNATDTEPISGNGTTTVTQTGCSISYNPLSAAGLVGSSLTPSQQASMVRTGIVSGNNVTITGLLALVDTVASARAGFTVGNISSNVLNATGQVSTGYPPVITLNQTGRFAGTGTYSIGGQTGSFSETITSSSTATFARGGIITTVAGFGSVGFAGDGGQATSARFSGPLGVAVDASGNFFIADSGNNRIRKVSANGTVTTVAGNGTAGFSGDGGPATSAALSDPYDVAVDAAGNVFIADNGNNRIRKVTPSGTISTVAGNGVPSSASRDNFSGDGGLATSASLNDPMGIAVDTAGNLFIADTYNNRIRKVTVDGTISTVAGNGARTNVSGSGGFSGDGGPATSAALYNPFGVALDAAGNLFIADGRNDRIRKVTTNGIISTVAGNGVLGAYGMEGFSGDGGPATSAQLYFPAHIVVDLAGNLFFSDTGNGRIREVAIGGTISTVAGNGKSGDGGPAVSAAVNPWGVALDAYGNLFMTDVARIRKVSLVATPAITQ